jgi:hypothetical protein
VSDQVDNSKYESMVLRESRPEDIARAALVDDGCSVIQTIGLLIRLFGVSVKEAKEPCVLVKTGKSLDEYHEDLIPDLTQALEDMETETPSDS